MPDASNPFAIGLFIDTRCDGAGDGPGARQAIEGFLAEGIAAEEAGFEGVFVPEHHQHPAALLPDPLALLAALAGRTTRIRLATAPLVPGYGWNPMHLAEAAALVDQLSHGRLTLMLGAGDDAAAFRRFGRDPALAGSLLDEAAALIRRAWTAGEPFDFAGRHIALERVWLTPKPFRRDPHPPLWATGDDDAALDRGADFASGWCDGPLPIAAAEWNRRAARFRAAVATRGIAAPRLVLLRDAFVAGTREEAEEIAAAAFLPAWRAAFARGALARRVPAIGSAAALDRDALRRHAIVGTPADCVAAIARLREECDFDYLVLRLRSPAGPVGERVLQAIRLAGAELLPRCG